MTIEIIGNAKGYTGYSKQVRSLLKGFKPDADILFTQIQSKEIPYYNDPKVREAVNRLSQTKKSGTLTKVFILPPTAGFTNMLTGDKNIIYFPWETSKLPDYKTNVHTDWVTTCNKFDKILTTSNYCKNVFGKQVDVPVSVVYPAITITPNSVSKENFFKLLNAKTNEEKNKKFILVCGKSEGRKNLGETLRWLFTVCDDSYSIILKTFATGDSDHDNREISKTLRETKQTPDFHGKTLPTIYLITHPLSEAKMKSLYTFSDLTVLLSHSEGFGYPIGESIACGTDVICTAGSGGEEIIRNSYPAVQAHSCLVDAYLAPITTGRYIFFRCDMEWFYPRFDSFIDKFESKIANPINMLPVQKQCLDFFSPENAAESFLREVTNI